ncbi:hypothetical protein [Gelidibacter mesophilus]|nr:hypothetical protein [Gelidibacter mesophilus]
MFFLLVFGVYAEFMAINGMQVCLIDRLGDTEWIAVSDFWSWFKSWMM